MRVLAKGKYVWDVVFSPFFHSSHKKDVEEEEEETEEEEDEEEKGILKAVEI